MKTLKQIREEYNSKYMTQEVPEEFMLEDKSFKSSAPTVPATKDMPSLLIFRRVSFRLYPNKQVVALYYSKLVDKYLSIPFGPTGNLNLSEAVVLDEKQLDEILPLVGGALAAGAEMLAGAGARAALSGGARAALGAARSGISKLGRSSVGRFAKSMAKSAARQAFKSALTPKKDDGNKADDSTPAERPSGELLRDKPTAKTHSSWENSPSARPIDQVRQREMVRKDAQSSKTVAENKIIDIRKMVNEGIETKDLLINGRSITLNTSMAKRILEVYDSVNTKNKKIVEGMLNEDLESFKKLLNFSIRN
jgi:hypothetical protein